MRAAIVFLASSLCYATPTYNDVARIFSERCLGCHAASVKMGSLNLETYDGFQQGGTHTSLVVPGKSAESRLYLLITGKAMPAMPMDGGKLTAEQIETVRAWIDAGASPPLATARATGPNQDRGRKGSFVDASAKAPLANARGSEGQRTPLLDTLDPDQSRDGNRAVADAQGSIQSRDRKGAPTPTSQIFDLAFSPDGKLLALASYRDVRLIDASTKQQVAILGGHANAVRAVAFSRDGRLLAGAGGLPARSGEVLVWDVAERKLLHTLRGHSDCIYGVAFSPDGHTIATASYDKLVKLWDIAAEKEIRTYRDHIDSVYAVSFTPDGKRLVSGAADRTIKIWNVATGERLYTFSEPQDGINTLAIDPSGKFVAAGGLDKSIRIWSLGETGGTLLHSQIAHEDAILRLAWSSDGAELLSSSADRTVKLFRAADLSELQLFREPDWVYGLQFAPNGKSFAIGRFDGSLAITP